jgi:hypothetical protein
VEQKRSLNELIVVVVSEELDGFDSNLTNTQGVLRCGLAVGASIEELDVLLVSGCSQFVSGYQPRPTEAVPIQVAILGDALSSSKAL